jgi:hypothetical protein
MQHEPPATEAPKRAPILVAAVRWLRGSGVSPSAARLLLDLVEHCNANGECFPSVERLMENTGMSRRTTQRALGELLKHTHPPIRQRIRGHHSSALYSVTEQLWEPSTETRQERRATGDASTETRQERRSGAPSVTLTGVTSGAALKEELTQRTNPRTYPVAAVAVATAPLWNQRACDLLIKRYGGTAPGGRITKALRPLVAKHGEAEVLDAWSHYLGETPAEYLSPEKFATTFDHWRVTGAPIMSPLSKHNAEALGLLEPERVALREVVR